MPRRFRGLLVAFTVCTLHLLLVQAPSTSCSESSIDRSCPELAILEENAITGDHILVERQARLGAVPLNEFIDRVSISALRLGRAKAIQDRRFAVVQIREACCRFRRPTIVLSGQT